MYPTANFGLRDRLPIDELHTSQLLALTTFRAQSFTVVTASQFRSLYCASLKKTDFKCGHRRLFPPQNSAIMNK
jgi:hypothetical protein